MEIGKINKMTILEINKDGTVLDGRDYGRLMLSPRENVRDFSAGDSVEVFIYPVGQDRLQVTLQQPLLQLGEFGMLRCVSVTNHGAFLDWGLDDDILCPYNQQRIKMEEKRDYLVRLYLDKTTGRITASSRLSNFLKKKDSPYTKGETVELIISGISDLGYNAVINKEFLGVLYKNEVFRPLHIGDIVEGYIKQIRDDGKIDLSLQKPGYGKVGKIAEDLLAAIEKNGGFLPLTDKSHPDEIRQKLGISKKSFKMAIGQLYKQKRIALEPDGLRITGDDQ